MEQLIEEFWSINQNKIQSWYIEKQNQDDIIISASPEFLLKTICDKLNIENLIASNVNQYTGKYSGENCYGDEKVNLFRNKFTNITVNNFYSDSISDLPMAKLAKQAYLIKKGKILDWNEYKPTPKDKFKKIFVSKEFLVFLFVGVINTINGVLFSWLYTFLINPNLSFVFGYITSLTISYYLNSILTFKQNLSFQKYFKFCISYIPNFCIQNLVVVLCYNILEWNNIIAYILAAAIGVPITFILMKIFTFRDK